MIERGPLSEPPAIEVDVLEAEDRSADTFVWVRKVKLENHYADGTRSAPYAYFLVERKLLDAVCIVLYRQGPEQPEVLLRTQLRPPLCFRKDFEIPVPAEGTGAVQWEVPAGLIEQGEHGFAGLCARAHAEAREEVGLDLAPTRFQMLGSPSSLSPGLLAEKLHFVVCEVRADDAYHEAPGDGHPVEERSVCRFVPLSDALGALDSGLLHDLKTEVALYRLRSHLGIG